MHNVEYWCYYSNCWVYIASYAEKAHAHEHCVYYKKNFNINLRIVNTEIKTKYYHWKKVGF